MTELILLVAVFVFLVFGTGPALMPAGLGSPLHRVVAGAAASLAGLYLFGFALYVLKLPPAVQWLALAGPCIVTSRHWRVVAELWGDRDVRQATLAWLAVTAWVLAWQFTVYSYSGATWRVDWHEHYDRARFFIEHWDEHHRFIGAYSLAARPPLANLITAGFLSLAGVKFHVYQATCTLFASLVVWPVCLLQRQFAAPGRTARFAWAALLLMALPAFIQNATFTWTKLPTAFFILVGIALLTLREAKFPARLAGWLALTAAMLAHYSAGPWIVAVGAAEIVRSGWRSFFTRSSGRIGLACLLFFATWLGWSAWRLGWAETLGANTTVTHSAGLTAGKRLGQVAQNLYYTAVPVLFRPIKRDTDAATDPVARVRDEYFNAVQSSVPMIAGSLGLVVAAGLLWTARGRRDHGSLGYWGTLLGIAVVLGIAVHPDVVPLGVAHVCLVSFALLVTAWLAARVPDSTRFWQVTLAVGVTIDLALGIVLQFAVESLWLPEWLHPLKTPSSLATGFGLAAPANLEARQKMAEPFLQELPGAVLAIVLLFFAAGMLLHRCFRAEPARLNGAAPGR